MVFCQAILVDTMALKVRSPKLPEQVAEHASSGKAFGKLILESPGVLAKMQMPGPDSRYSIRIPGDEGFRTYRCIIHHC